MSSEPQVTSASERTPLVGAVLLGLLVFCWCNSLWQLHNEGFFLLIMFFGFPAFFLTPVVTGILLFLLRRSMRSTWLHRAVFYGSAGMLILWSIFLLAGLSSIK